MDYYSSLIYVNDFYLECKLKDVLFADDTNLFISDENIGEIFHQMNKELKVSLVGLTQISSLLILVKQNEQYFTSLLKSVFHAYKI